MFFNFNKKITISGPFYFLYCSEYALVKNIGFLMFSITKKKPCFLQIITTCSWKSRHA